MDLEEKMREEMMNDVIKKFGFEDVHTIIFCGMVERKVDLYILWTTYDEYMRLDIMLDE